MSLQRKTIHELTRKLKMFFKTVRVISWIVLALVGQDQISLDL